MSIINWAHLSATEKDTSSAPDSIALYGNTPITSIVYGTDTQNLTIPMQNVPMYEAQSPNEPIGFGLINGYVKTAPAGDLTNSGGQDQVGEIVLYFDKMMELTGASGNNFAYETVNPAQSNKLTVKVTEFLQQDFTTALKFEPTVSQTLGGKLVTAVNFTLTDANIDRPILIALNDLKVSSNA